jgi:endo-1,4-beta-xylanase
VIDRRSLLACAAASALTSPALAKAEPLKSLAAAKGVAFGSIIGTTPIGQKTADFDDLNYRRLVETECQVIVPENELKMAWTWSGPETYNLDGADSLASYASRQKLDFRGHNLLWNDSYTPKWLLSFDFGPNPKRQAESMLRSYIGAITDHFGNRIKSWDVINEAIDPETGALRSTVFTRILGEDAIRIAFEETRARLPRCQLVYNDFMCWSRLGANHRDGVLALLRRLKDNNVPVDALGVQSHLGLGFELADRDQEAWDKFLTSVTSLGLELLVTEFDVNDGGLAGNASERDAVTAEVAKAYLDQMLSYKEMKTVICWGLVDKYSWIPAYMPRDDKQAPRPTLFDSDFQPKPMYYAVADAFRATTNH